MAAETAPRISRMLWAPSAQRIAETQLSEFQQRIESTYDQSFSGYSALHQWSIDSPAEFWQSVVDVCAVQFSTQPETILAPGSDFAASRWFQGARLNFAENLLRFRDERLAMVGVLEDGSRQTYTYAQLASAVGELASAMRGYGIVEGDRVAGLLPNLPETIIAMLATTSIGAIWSSCSPDFGVQGACDRFSQIAPRLLFTCDSYLYGGKRFDCLEKVGNIQSAISSIEQVIVFPLPTAEPAPLDKLPERFQVYDNFVAGFPSLPLTFKQLPFDHPVYIMYSSGTTGAPKCIVHGAGGTLLQHLKEHRLHVDLMRQDKFFYFTTCGWMMWNWLASGLASGATLVVYDGSPFAESTTSEGGILLDLIDQEQISIFGTSAKYIAALEKMGCIPKDSHELDSLRLVLSTGSPLSDLSFEYVYRDIKADVHLASISGGTDIISCFMLGNPNLPVYAGELQCAGLGLAVEFRNDTEPAAIGVTGELVCTKPFPAVPIGFWNDPDDRKFNAAYFDQRPGVWTHGDYGEATVNGGFIVHGRSDAVLNPAGVRIGTAEIYRQVETIAEVVDSVVVGQHWEGDERVVLFVMLAANIALDDELVARIKASIRQNTTPRHVPAKVLAVADIPRTISGKIVEIAVRKVIHGHNVDNTEALANPEALAYFRNREELASS